MTIQMVVPSMPAEEIAQSIALDAHKHGGLGVVSVGPMLAEYVIRSRQEFRLRAMSWSTASPTTTETV
jgi:hypothetical protein